MRVSTLRERIRSIPFCYAAQYRQSENIVYLNSLPFRAMADASIAKRDFNTVTVEELLQDGWDESWWRAMCECCGSYVTTVVWVTTDHEDEYGDSSFCVDCIREALQLLEEVDKQ